MKSTLLKELEPGKLYSSSALHAARHFWTVAAETRAIEVADELQAKPEVPVVTVLDGDNRALGLIPRGRLFALLSKPFGREILGRMDIAELAEKAPVFDAHTGIFTLAEETLKTDPESAEPYHILTDGDGSFRGVLASRDLTDYLSRITQDDIDLAGKLQERLQAGNEEIGGAGWYFEAWSRAAKGVGGDFYFTRRLPGERSFFALCDVSGKGVAASLVVSMVWGMLKMYDFRQGLTNLIIKLNESIVGTFHLEKYLTGFFAIFDASRKELLAADMGHSHSFIFRGNRVLAPRSQSANLPIGIEADINPTVLRWRLRKGDRLFVFSDGLTEQENEAGVEYGERRLIEAIRNILAQGESLNGLLSVELDTFRQRTPQQDDMSFACLALAERNGEALSGTA